MIPPLVASTAGQEAAELAEQCGFYLEPWQRRIVDVGLAEDAAGAVCASTVKVICSRQNGKNAAIEVVELHDLVLGGLWVVHTAHLFPTARESFQRLLGMVESCPDIAERLTKKLASPMSGYELQFKGGGRIRFIARSRTSGRGLTADKLILDEDQDLTDDELGALLPVVSARPGSQVWYLGSAPGLDSLVSQRLRARGRKVAEVIAAGNAHPDPRFAYFEHSADPKASLDDRDAWAQANPGLGPRITEEAIEAERASMSDDMFARERLSISPDLLADGFVLPNWQACADPASTIVGALALAVDVSPDQRFASIAAAGPRDDGRMHVELIERQLGTAQVVQRVVELVGKHRPVAVALDPAGQAGALLADLTQAGVNVTSVSAREHGQACGALAAAVEEGTVVHLDDPPLNAAVTGAKRRALGDLWAWDRKKSDVDISPLVAVTLARWMVAGTVADAPKPVFAY